LEVGELAVRRALDAAGLEPRDVDHLFFVTVTGIATPSLDARLMNRLGLRPDVRRAPIFGLGCVAGAAGTARASDVLRAFPDQVAVLLSVELCSLTLQREDVSIANVTPAACSATARRRWCFPAPTGRRRAPLRGCWPRAASSIRT